MPQRSTAIHIPQPCPESWAAMTPTAQGRHCAVCATEVVDFTRMSEAEVLAFLAAWAVVAVIFYFAKGKSLTHQDTDPSTAHKAEAVVVSIFGGLLVLTGALFGGLAFAASG